MKDSLGCIIYVGKSKNLKNRVQSYFQNSKSHTQKVKKLVQNLKDFDYILTDTEFEAFMLECKLIKEIKPTYNKKMKSPQSYTYIVIKMDEEYRKIELTNCTIENDNNIYFGPYSSKSSVEKILQGLKEFLKINCSNPSNKKVACLNYSLGMCIGMCLGGSAIEQYNEILDKIISLLNGTDKSILEDLKERMLNASENFDFETAAKYRDLIESLNFLLNREKVIAFTKENHNIAMIEHLSEHTIKLFLIKGNKVLFCEKFALEAINFELIRSMIRSNIFICFKNAAFHSPLEISSEDIDEAQIIYSYLKGSPSNNRTIPEHWLDSEDNPNLVEEIDKLLDPVYELLSK
ncbi:UvrB/UvrC motif-containing protein [Bacillus sp. 1NLA3E]|uniref:UvrB/UvrC motif-containing protein n=1 Tax=Bacillus sp. 1NLA3E TaxID=666686 RepID=UPI001EFFC7AF|nr:UvrB/UvrC motif-containing protein [Bacillus sp. 1NLA3E]